MRITIIGTGNVAFHLSKRFKEKGFEIAEIVGRNAENGKKIATACQSKFQKNYKKTKTDSDLYIIAVSDSAIENVAKELAQLLDNQFVVHTSGSIPSTVLQPYFKQFGSFYPLQTFSINSQPDFDKIPIFINASYAPLFPYSGAKATDFLKKIAFEISPNVYELSDEKRVILHIAAVFVNNFTNHLFTIGEKILEPEGLPFDILKPLILETVNKIQQHSPHAMQTGPARRGDSVTIEKHLAYLTENEAPQYFDLYKILTDSILQTRNMD
jgi:predicted short-subunit dehydrogenase-like oxidoreductase (DUF2520 family)